MNFKCGVCVHYQGKSKTVQGKQVPLQYGWCSLKSVYGAKPRTDDPADPQRVEEGELAKPVIVWKDRIQVGCVQGIKSNAS